MAARSVTDQLGALSLREAPADRAQDARRQPPPAGSAAPTTRRPRQRYQYFCVIDVEATCEEDKAFSFDNEIIEFPAVLLDGRTMQTIDTFHAYVRPVLNPTLSAYCTKLTGITQAQVDASDTFPLVLQRFETWLRGHGLLNQHANTVAFITDGPWDLRDFVLDKQCGLSGIARPAYFMRWIDLRLSFRYYFDTRERFSLDGMLRKLGMQFEGRPHAGMDDTRNIARVARELMTRGADLKINSHFDSSTPVYTPGTAARRTEQRARSVEVERGAQGAQDASRA